MSWTGVAIAGGTIVGGVLAGKGAEKAGNALAGANDRAALLQAETAAQTRQDQQPYRDVATGTRGAYDDLLRQQKSIVDDFRFNEKAQMEAAPMISRRWPRS